MERIKYHEKTVHLAVHAGELMIDNMGQVWRLCARRGDRWNPQTTRLIPCVPRRAEHQARGYFQVRVMTNGHRVAAAAHRLVWYHFFGPIPLDLTINHKDGIKTNNHPNNLELATNSQQILHALHTLKVGRTDQNGMKNSMATISQERVAQIKQRRLAGEKLVQIANDYGIAFQTVSKIAKGQRRQKG